MKIRIVINVPNESGISINGKHTNPPYGHPDPKILGTLKPGKIELPDITGMSYADVKAKRDEWHASLAQIAAARSIWEYHFAYMLKLVSMADGTPPKRDLSETAARGSAAKKARKPPGRVSI